MGRGNGNRDVPMAHETAFDDKVDVVADAEGIARILETSPD